MRTFVNAVQVVAADVIKIQIKAKKVMLLVA